MQVVDKDGNVYGQGLQITSINGKPKVPLINTDITIGTTAIVGGTSGRLLFNDAGVVGETNGVHWDKVNSRMGLGTPTPLAKIHISGSVTASGAIARGSYFNNTLVAAANNDVLVGLDINPTFTNGAFTGVSNIGIRVKGDDVSGGSGYSLYAYGGQAFIKGNWSIVNGYNLIVQNRTGLDSLRVRGDGLTILEKLAVSDGINKGFTVSYSGVGGYQFGLAVTDAGVAFTNGAAASRPVSFSMNTGEILRIHQNYTSIVTNNFLIGTTTDAGYKLDVAGTGRFSGSLTINNDMVINSAGDRSITWALNDLRFMVGANNIARFFTTGTVFISTIGVATSTGTGLGPSMAGITASSATASATFFANPQVNHLQTKMLIGGNDGAYGGNTTQGIGLWIYGGNNTTNNSYGNVVIAHDGTTTRGNVLIGTSTNVPSAVVNVNSTTQGFLPPRMSNAQMVAIATPSEGLVVYDLTNRKLCCYDGATWQPLF
jgi:hypothetical protein